MSSQNSTTQSAQTSRLSKSKEVSNQRDSLGISHSYIPDDDYISEDDPRQNESYKALLDSSKLDARKMQVKVPDDHKSPDLSPSQAQLQNSMEIADEHDSQYEGKGKATDLSGTYGTHYSERLANQVETTPSQRSESSSYRSSGHDINSPGSQSNYKLGLTLEETGLSQDHTSSSLTEASTYLDTATFALMMILKEIKDIKNKGVELKKGIEKLLQRNETLLREQNHPNKPLHEISSKQSECVSEQTISSLDWGDIEFKDFQLEPPEIPETNTHMDPQKHPAPIG
jgi:hypothetical protein